MSTAIFWFRHDLRLHDNPALCAALKQADQVIPVYIHNETESGDWPPGSASRWWLHHSLNALSSDIKARGGHLILRQGPSLDVLSELVNQTAASEIYCTALYEPAHLQRDNLVEQALAENNVTFNCYHGNLLCPPGQVKNLSGEPYKVFTPFYRSYLKNGYDTRLSATNKKLASALNKIKSGRLNDFALLPDIPWYADFQSHWQPGETGAKKRLQQFCKQHLASYPVARDVPADDGTTGLSPHLHFGEISPRQIIAVLDKTSMTQQNRGLSHARDEVIRELVWRDFAHHVLVHFPHTTDRPFNPRFNDFPWKRSDKKFLQAWQQGRTGIPIIDAGMRQLWHSGWMHNRVRMIVASLLAKNANLHWLQGARWFWDTLLDADLANNSMNWQWVAGCGVDAAPYFRIFNPVSQGKKFDTQGSYVRRWVPELTSFPDRYIHDPWTAPAEIQQQSGVIIGKDYPRPVIDIAGSRQQALQNYNTHRKKD